MTAVENLDPEISAYVCETRRLESLPSSTELSFYPDVKALLSAVLKHERLAFDVITSTSEAGRHQQHEKFYGGAPHVVKANLYRGYDFTRALAMVDRALNLSGSG